MGMDMRISGSGKIPAGEFERISIHGSGSLGGLVRCNDFFSSGAVRGEALICIGEMKTTGNAVFSGDLSVGKLIASGSVSCGDVIAKDSVKLCGSLHAGNVTAKEAHIDGVIHCEGQINSEKISINFQNRMTIGSIAGDVICLHKKGLRPMFGNIRVLTAVEGDEIELERTECPLVKGRKVTIGKGCRIELVQYGEEITVSPKAAVNRIEKI